MKWNAKAKGNAYERMSAKYWADLFGIKADRMKGSGRYVGLPGDLFFAGDSIMNDFVIDVKAEQNLLNKKVLDYYKKNDEDAQGKPSMLEIHVNYDKPYILISRKDFANLLFELNGYRKEIKT